MSAETDESSTLGVVTLGSVEAGISLASVCLGDFTPLSGAEGRAKAPESSPALPCHTLTLLARIGRARVLLHLAEPAPKLGPALASDVVLQDGGVEDGVAGLGDPRGAVLGHHLGRRALASVEADVGATRLSVNDDGSKRCLDLARHFLQELERFLSDEEHSLIVFGGDKEVDHTVVVAVIVSGDAENVQYAD